MPYWARLMLFAGSRHERGLEYRVHSMSVSRSLRRRDVSDFSAAAMLTSVRLPQPLSPIVIPMPEEPATR